MYILLYIHQEPAMFETRIRKVGNSAVVTLSAEMLAALDAREGDTVYLVRGDDGSLKITPQNPELAAALEAAQIVRAHRRALRLEHLQRARNVEDALDAEGHVFGDGALDVDFVLSADELAVDGGFHQSVEESPTQNAPTEIEQLLVVVHHEVDRAHLGRGAKVN